jgi:alanyl-tRNA synthetase
VVILGTVINDKPFLSIIISDSLVKNKGIDANKLIKEISKLIKGGGGGQAFYATAGGNDKNGLQEAIALAKDLIFNK